MEEYLSIAKTICFPFHKTPERLHARSSAEDRSALAMSMTEDSAQYAKIMFQNLDS